MAFFGRGPIRIKEEQPASISEPPHAQPNEPTNIAMCVRCEKLETKLEKVEKQRDDLVEENRKLLKKNGILREENTTLRQRQRKEQASLFDESQSITNVVHYSTPYSRRAKP